MSQHRIALATADRAAARLSRGQQWAPSQPISGNRNRPALSPSSPTLTQSQSVSSIRMNRPALHSNAPKSTQSQSITGNRTRPALISSSSKLTQSQSVSSIRMNRPALHSNALTSTQPQSITGNRTRPALIPSSSKLTQSQSASSIRMNRSALRSNPPASTQPQSTSSIRNRPALQSSTTARLTPSTVDIAKPATRSDRAQARRERLAALKTTDASHVGNKPFAEVISDVRRVQARLAAYEARKAERTRAPAASCQPVTTAPVPTRPQECPRPRAVSPMTLLVESLDFSNLRGAASAPAASVVDMSSPVADVDQIANLIADSTLAPPTPSAPKAPRFRNNCARPTTFPAFPKPENPAPQIKGILRKANRRCKPSVRKSVAFAKEDEVHVHERWIGIWQCRIPEYYLFNAEGQPEHEKNLFVWPEPLDQLIGKLRGWEVTPEDKYKYTYVRGSGFSDHSKCTRGVPGKGCERGLRHQRLNMAWDHTYPGLFYSNEQAVALLDQLENALGPP